MPSPDDRSDSADLAPRPGGDSALGRAGAYAKGVARRQDILDRAISVFAERGAAGTSLRSIARAIGVSHAALQHYFDSREQLLVAVYDHANRSVGADDPDGAVDRLTAAAARNVGVPGYVELYTDLVAASLHAESETARSYFGARFASLRADFAARLRREQEQGRVRADCDPDQVAALLIAASDGLQVQWLLDPEIPLPDVFGAFGALLSPPTLDESISDS